MEQSVSVLLAYSVGSLAQSRSSARLQPGRKQTRQTETQPVYVTVLIDLESENPGGFQSVSDYIQTMRVKHESESSRALNGLEDYSLRFTELILLSAFEAEGGTSLER